MKLLIFLLLLFAVPWGCASPQTTAPRPPPSAQEESDREPTASAPALPQPVFAIARSGDGSAPSIADIAERVTVSVVSISTEREAAAQQLPFPFPFFGPPGGEPRREQGTGSGVIVTSDGVVLTNNHLVERTKDIRVTTADGKEYAADVVGTDKKSDLAVLRLKGEPLRLTPIAIGDSSRLRLGDVVLAVGNPFGVGQTVTMGIVSAKGRANVGIVDYEDFIQTDAAINPGNSGGALVNMEGELVGINTAILSRSGGYQGIGFAIPSNMARPIMDSLLEHGRVARGFLGVHIQDVDHDLAQALGLPDTAGVLVSAVQPNGAADRAGLERGDVITHVDGTPADSTGRLRNLIASKGSAASKLRVMRAGKELTFDVQLDELPDTEAKTPPGKDKPSSPLGMELSELTPALAQRFDIEGRPGTVVVTQVERNSPAHLAGVRAGDVLLELNRQSVTTPAQASQRIKDSKGPLLVLVVRGGQTRYLVIRR